MIPTFRYAILMADDKEPEKMTKLEKSKTEFDDNVFHQF